MSELSEEIVRSWGTRDVALWLQEIGCGYCTQDFRKNRIDGPALLSMTANGLRVYPSLSDSTKKENLKAQIARLPGSALVKGGGLSRKASRGDKKRKAAQVREDSLSPPPLPERPQPQVNVDHQQYDEDEYSFDDDDSFDSDSDFYDEEDAGSNNNNNKASLAPPEPPAAQSQDSIRKLQAKFMAFGLRGMDNQQLTPAEEQYLVEENEDDEQDVYDVPPEFQHQYYMPPDDEEDADPLTWNHPEGDIYDVPPEEAQGHYPPPTTQEPHHVPPNNFTSSPQPMTKLPQLRAPIKQTDKAPPYGGIAANAHHDPPMASSSISDKMKAFQNHANETGKNFPSKPGNSPKLPTKFPPKSPQLPPKNQQVVSNSQDNHNDGDALSNMPEHLRDRFKKSKQQSRIRKQSKSQEDSPPEITTELPSQQKSAIASRPFLQKQAPNPIEMPPKPMVGKAKETQDKLSTSDNAGKSIKDRMKMFSSSSADEPVTPKSPASQKWPPSDSKQPVVSSMGKPPMDAKQKFPPKLPAENKKPVNTNGRDAPSVPPLPDRNTKPPKFGGFKQPADIGKRPPMPLPATSYDDEENYDPPTVHVPQAVNDENYDPPQFHREEIMEENYDPPQLHQEIQEDTYDPPPLPNRIPGSPGFAVSKQPRFPPKEDRRTTEPSLPPRPPKSTNFLKGPAADVAAGGRRNTFATPVNVKPPMEKPALKPPRSASPNPLESYPWYHGDIDRRTIESALEKDSIDGCFIVRNPSKPEEKKLGFYSLSIWHCGKTRHLRIRCRADKRYVVGESKEDERPFDSVAELIRFHKKTPLLLKSGGSTVLTCLPTSLA